jgi:hypothetical protein
MQPTKSQASGRHQLPHGRLGQHPSQAGTPKEYLVVQWAQLKRLSLLGVIVEALT